MKFCSQCSNMLYIQLSNETNQLSYYCRCCGLTDNEPAMQGVCVLKTQLHKGEQQFSHLINRYTKLDPTLPRIYHVRCPDANCKTNLEQVANPEVIYMRYDDVNLKYLYICVECDTTWQ
jgi:DNA-directed RNA polymerase subunit M/transcription elongation factor TFIIS